MTSMFNPPHPGLTLRDDILPALNLQVGEAAVQLRRRFQRPVTAEAQRGAHALKSRRRREPGGRDVGE